MVFCRPSFRVVRGCHWRSCLALVMLGFLLRGSSGLGGLNTSSDFEFVSCLIVFARSSMVISWSLPMLTISPLALGFVSRSMCASVLSAT